MLQSTVLGAARCAFLGLIALTACEPLPRATPVWQPKVVLIADSGLGGCAAGNLTEHDGDELVATAQSGSVYVAVRTGSKFVAGAVAKLPGEMIQCAIGDADPSRPGLEVVCVGSADGPEDSGAPGAVWLLTPRQTAARDAVPEFEQHRVLEDSALVHGVCVGDVDPNLAGSEIYAVGFSNRILQAHRAETGAEFSVRELGKTSGPGKCVTPFAGSIAIGCANGSVHMLQPAGGALTVVELTRLPSGAARIAALARSLLIACDDGKLVRLDLGEDGKNRLTTLFEASNKLRGAVIADLVPEAPGLELATAGYHKQLSILTSDPKRPRALQHFQDSDKFHHVATGEFGGLRVDGHEVTDLVACGYSKNLTVFRRMSR